MITQRLLEAVFSPVAEFMQHGDTIRFRLAEDSIEWHEVNIYELMHLVKEWAYKEDMYVMQSGRSPMSTGMFRCSIMKGGTTIGIHRDAGIDNEVGAVFRAGDWIVNKTKGENNEVHS